MKPTLLSALVLVALPAAGAPLSASPADRTSISGVVLSERGPVAGASVAVQTTDLRATTNARGEFTFTELEGRGPVFLSASAPGFYIAGGEAVELGSKDVVLTLTAHPTADDPTYEWLSAFATDEERGSCQHCHSRAQGTGPRLPFEEWLDDAHSRSATNFRFLTMYLGSDVAGNRSLPTRYHDTRDYGRIPLPPPGDRPYYGPGYRLDFPATAGNCGACHIPIAAADDPYGVDPTAVVGTAREGVSCDFCHKIWDVALDTATGLPYPSMPGVLSFELRRPGHEHQLFVGPLDDVAPGEDVYSSLYRESRYCAPCHFGVFWDTVVYNSFGEWLASAYSDPRFERADTCQGCHMPRGAADHFVRLDAGGRRRAPATLASHLMPGVEDDALCRTAATLEVAAERDGEAVEVEIVVRNSGTGHHLPTGSPLRQVLLTVEAIDAEGVDQPLEEGPVLPDWAGDLADRPGRAYAKVLEELWTGVRPSAAYWNPTRIRSDTRLAALASDHSRYRFTVVGGGPVSIHVRLILRRAFYELARQKGWEDPDRVIADRIIEVSDSPLRGARPQRR